MEVNLDKFEMYYLLESCFRGSHLRSNTILRFVDEWYNILCEGERDCLYKWILRDIYEGEFKERHQLCGADKIFMARFNPENRFRVTVKGIDTETFFMNGLYYVNSKSYCNPELITKIEKI